MRVIGEIPHPKIKITIFHWNNRYLIKLESGLMEQTFKIPDYELTEESDLQKIINPDFINKAIDRFDEMANSFQVAFSKIQ